MKKSDMLKRSFGVTNQECLDKMDAEEDDLRNRCKRVAEKFEAVRQAKQASRVAVEFMRSHPIRRKGKAGKRNG